MWYYSAAGRWNMRYPSLLLAINQRSRRGTVSSYPVYVAQSGRWYAGDALLNKEFYKKTTRFSIAGSRSNSSACTYKRWTKHFKTETFDEFFAKSG